MSQPISPTLVQDLELSTEQVIFGAWNLFKKHWKQFYIVGIVWFVLLLVAQFSLEFVDERSLAYPVLLIGGVVLGLILNLGWMWVSIKLSRDESIVVLDLFDKVNKLPAYFVATLLYQLLIIAGLLLFIVPGIYFSIKYAYVPYLIVDKNASISQAFGKSSRMTQGIKLRLIWLGFAVSFISTLGFFVFLIGGLVTLPIGAIAPALIYSRLLQRLEPEMPDRSTSSLPATAKVEVTETTKSVGPPPGLPTA